jgi:hypothetical protein
MAALLLPVVYNEKIKHTCLLSWRGHNNISGHLLPFGR